MTSSFEVNAATIRFLESHGYEVAWRERDFVECLLSHGDERWLGIGTSRDAALSHALCLALPSELARRSFATALASSESPASVSSTHEVDSTRRAESDDRVGSPDAGTKNGSILEESDRSASHSIPSIDETPTSAAPRGFLVDGTPEHPQKDEERASIPSVAMPAAIESPPARRAPITLPPLSSAEAMVRLSALEQDILATRDEIAAWSPLRQRLAIAVWTCQGRAIVEASDRRDVHLAMGRIVPHLKELSERLWPGNVEVLKFEATPRDVLLSTSRAGTPEAAPPRSWFEASEWAERKVSENERGDESAQRDDDGWRDARALVPEPAEPDALLDELAGEIAGTSGVLDAKPGPEVVAALRAGATRESEAQRWITFARRARWLRSSVVDTWTWGCIVGRLRFVATCLPKGAVRKGLDEILDSDFVPAKNWASELGIDPHRDALERRVEALFSSVPSADADDAAWSKWLALALDDSEVAIDRIADSVPSGARNRIATIEPQPGDHESGRRFRRRLNKLRARLTETSDPSESSTPSPTSPIVEKSPRSWHAVTDDRPAWITDVAARIRGTRVLLICNRADPDVDETIKTILGVTDYERVEDSMRRVQSACDRIREGRYDVVLSATGFQSHKVDDHLAEASRFAKVRYVRVNRARPLAVLRALARELGLIDSQHRLRNNA